MPRVVDQDRSVAKRKTCKQCGAVNEYMSYDDLNRMLTAYLTLEIKKDEPA